MKTPEDILSTCTVKGYGEHGELLYDVGEIKEAMKEYAKQWVGLAATEAGDHNRTITQNANIIWKMKKEIDAQ